MYIFEIINRIEKSSMSCVANLKDQQRGIDKYKERAAQLFDRLQGLQQNNQKLKSLKQKQVINQFCQIQKKVVEVARTKEGFYSNILEIVKKIQTELYDQRSQEEKCRRSVKNWIDSTERSLNQSFQRLQKQKIKSEAGLEKLIESKIQSFVLKNKAAWNQGTLINQDPYIEEVDFLTKQYKNYLNNFQKQCEKLKKETFISIKECTRMVQEELNNGEEEQILSFMKTIHMEVTTKLKSLKDQRERTQERLLNVLQKVVASCVVNTSV